jgi:catechol 2,3-dioxygenase-like lactoylglutathione lyase family enzyme
MSRVQVALNVSDLEGAIDFYAKLFGTEPAKRRPGYANFAIAEPPLKLVLMERADTRGAGVGGALNHLGVEVESTDLVSAATQRLTGEGLDTTSQDATTCCYAVQHKVWVHDPDQVPWEVYTVLPDALADAPSLGCGVTAAEMSGGMVLDDVPAARSSCC